MPTNTRREIEFTTGGIGPDIVMLNPWGWTQIKRLLDEVTPLTTERKSPDSLEGIETLAIRLFGFNPQGKEELRRLRDNAKRYFRQARCGRPETREILMPYRRELRALVWATRQRLATTIALVNPHGWDKRAWGLFHACKRIWENCPEPTS